MPDSDYALLQESVSRFARDSGFPRAFTPYNGHQNSARECLSGTARCSHNLADFSLQSAADSVRIVPAEEHPAWRDK